MKKLLSFALVLVLIISAFSGCRSSKKAKTADAPVETTEEPETVSSEYPSVPVHVEGAVFSGQAGDSVAVDLVFAPDMILLADNTVYDPDIASFSALMCADSYFREKDLDKGTQNRVLVDGKNAEDYDFTALMTEIGFSDAKHIETYKEKEYEFDTNDSATMNLGYMDTENADLFVAVVRGCFSAGEWLSVFDPGADSDNYGILTGEHPEWNEKTTFKGAGVAAERALEFIDSFIEEHDDESKENVILITGHSRGGMIAEILGAAFEERKDTRSFTYTFNASPVTENPEAKNCETVFNVFDSNDFYSDVLPFGSETFFRYGRDISADMSSDDSLKSSVAGLKGRDDYQCASPEVLSKYAEMFGNLFPDRSSLYDAVGFSERFENEADAQSRFDELVSLAGAEEGLGLDSAMTIEKIASSDGTYDVAVNYSGAVILAGYSKVLAYGGAAYDAFASLFSGDPDACAIAQLLNENAAGLSGGHLLINGYVLSRDYEG